MLKHLDISLKSPTSGKLLLNVNLIPNARKLALSQAWKAQMSNDAYAMALKCISDSPEAGNANNSQKLNDAFAIMAHMLDVIGVFALKERAEWSTLATIVGERVLSSLNAAPVNGNSGA